MIKKGDILIAMKTFSKELTAGNEYTAMSSQDNYNRVMIKQDDGTMYTYHVDHFEVNQKPCFGGEGMKQKTGKVKEMKVTDNICHICNWTNTSLINLGEPNEPRWTCQGCCKRLLDKQPETKQEILYAVCEIENSAHDMHEADKETREEAMVKNSIAWRKLQNLLDIID